MPSNKIGNSHHDDGEYKGEPVDDELANGPMENRSCTDVLCCLLFIAFLGGMIGIAGYAISKGNPNIIGRGMDSDGKICGVDAGYENYPYLYFTIPTKDYLKQTLCLSACPSGDQTTLPNTLQCKHNSLYTASPIDKCTGIKSTTAIGLSAASSSSKTGQLWVYNTTTYFGRYCLPGAAVDFAAEALATTQNNDLLEQWFSDVKTGWPVIAVCAGAAFVIGLIYMVLLRCFAGILTWFAILAYIIGLAVLGWRFYQNAVEEEANTGINTTTDSNAANNIKSQKYIGYICWGIAGISALMILCLYNRIRLAIAIIKAASEYVRDTLSVFLIPPVITVILVAWYTWWTITSIYLVSTGQTVALGETPLTSIAFDSKLKKLMIYQLLALLWVNAFVIAATQFIVASSVCLWYFAQGTGQGPSGTVRKGVWRLFRYHFGSIAFGSLLVAIVQLARIILAYFQKQAQKLKGKEGKIIRFAFNCLQCYLGCLERFIKFINKNAYIQIALTGKNFCLAAKDGFFLVLRNAFRMGALSMIGGIFILLGKVFIAAITALGAFLFLTKSTMYTGKLYNPFIIVALVFIFSYAIGAVFMTIYGLAADTILACFIVDEELNKKKNAPPRHCPNTLREFIDTHAKKE